MMPLPESEATVSVRPFVSTMPLLPIVRLLVAGMAPAAPLVATPMMSLPPLTDGVAGVGVEAAEGQDAVAGLGEGRGARQWRCR